MISDKIFKKTKEAEESSESSEDPLTTLLLKPTDSIDSFRRHNPPAGDLDIEGTDKMRYTTARNEVECNWHLRESEAGWALIKHHEKDLVACLLKLENRADLIPVVRKTNSHALHTKLGRTIIKQADKAKKKDKKEKKGSEGRPGSGARSQNGDQGRGSRGRGGGGRVGQIRCYNCRRLGHKADQCQQERQVSFQDEGERHAGRGAGRNRGRGHGR